MRLRLTSSTDAALHAIFDPQVLATNSNSPIVASHDRGSVANDSDEDYETLRRMLHQHEVVTYNEASDGSVDILVLVDEEPEDELLDRSFNGQEGALLHVPGGRLVACGVEYVQPAPLALLDKFPNMGSEACIPSGAYRCNAFSVHFSKADRERAMRKQIDPKLLRLARWPDKLMGLGYFSFIAAVAAVIALTAMQSRYTNYAALALCFLGVLALTAGLKARHRPTVLEAMRATRDLAPPQFVLMLQKIPDDVDTSAFVPGEFGPAVTGDWGPGNRP